MLEDMSDSDGENLKRLEYDELYLNSCSERIMHVIDGIVIEEFSVKMQI
jgi:hypothetical protein